MVFTDTTPRTGEECGACHDTFPTLADVFSHPCPAIDELRGRRPAATSADVHRGDSIDAPERRERTGERPSGGWPAMTNRYPGNCARCGQRVEAGQGHAVKNHAGGRGVSWAVEHKVSDCPAVGDTPAPKINPALAAEGRDSAYYQQWAKPEAPVAPAPEGDVRRANRYAGQCVRCAAWIDAEAGKLTKDASGAWAVDHPAGPCPTVEAIPEPAGPAYEPEKGDVHVVDGEFYRVHIAQRSGRPYAVHWTGTDWDFARGVLGRMSKTTLATADDAARFGAMFHACVFCTRPLDTPESTAVGYGPVCAAKRGLPWG